MGASYLEVQLMGLRPGELALGLVQEGLLELGYEAFREEGDRLYAYIARSRFDRVRLATQLQALGKGLNFTVEELPAQNWNAAYEAQLRPVCVSLGDGQLAIGTSSHPPVGGDWQLTIDPEGTFGDGHHPTTQLMLEQLHAHLLSGRRVLDVGCGSGILSVAASLWGAGGVDAIDIEPWAVVVAGRNAARNGCSNVTIRQQDMAELSGGPYALIMANVFYQLLIDNFQCFWDLLAPGGVLLASGLLGEQAQGLILRAEGSGWTCCQRGARAGWHVVVLARGS